MCPPSQWPCFIKWNQQKVHNLKLTLRPPTIYHYNCIIKVTRGGARAGPAPVPRAAPQHAISEASETPASARHSSRSGCRPSAWAGGWLHYPRFYCLRASSLRRAYGGLAMGPPFLSRPARRRSTEADSVAPLSPFARSQCARGGPLGLR